MNKSIKLKYRFALLLSTFFIGFVLYGVVSFYTLSKLKVGGPLYENIVQNKDIVADVLPPPEYIIESYLVTLQMVSSRPEQRGPLIDRLHALKNEYETRHRYWQQAGLDGKLGSLMLDASYQPAIAFFDRAFNELVPALASDDQARAGKVMEQLSDAYEQHRKAIDEVVKIALQRSEDDERSAAAQIDRAHMVMLIVLLVSLGAGQLVAWKILLGLRRRLGGEPDYAADVCRLVAAGRLDIDVAAEAGSNDSLLVSIRTMRSKLASTVSGIKEAADTLAVGTTQISAGNRDLAYRTEKQSASLERASRAVAVLSANVKTNASDANEANRLAVHASSIAEHGGMVVSDVVRTMQNISDSSAQIVDIIGVIDGIAFQTNILALNAAVEAARAGEQGRGFAVVAGEVRNLAQRSAAAAREIKLLIDDSVARMQSGSDMVGHAGSTMVDVVRSVREVSNIIARISASSQVQNAGIAQVHDSVIQMETVAEQNAALVEEAAAAASSLHSQAEALNQAVGTFRLEA